MISSISRLSFDHYLLIASYPIQEFTGNIFSTVIDIPKSRAVQLIQFLQTVLAYWWSQNSFLVLICTQIYLRIVVGNKLLRYTWRNSLPPQLKKKFQLRMKRHTHRNCLVAFSFLSRFKRATPFCGICTVQFYSIKLSNPLHDDISTEESHSFTICDVDQLQMTSRDNAVIVTTTTIDSQKKTVASWSAHSWRNMRLLIWSSWKY